jgi:hypothetical protein
MTGNKSRDVGEVKLQARCFWNACSSIFFPHATATSELNKSSTAGKSGSTPTIGIAGLTAVRALHGFRLCTRGAPSVPVADTLFPFAQLGPPGPKRCSSSPYTSRHEFQSSLPSSGSTHNSCSTNWKGSFKTLFRLFQGSDRLSLCACVCVVA